jgi:hypothetical protein
MRFHQQRLSRRLNWIQQKRDQEVANSNRSSFRLSEIPSVQMVQNVDDKVTDLSGALNVEEKYTGKGTKIQNSGISY